ITEVYGTNGGIKTAYTYTPYGIATSSGNTTQPLQWSSEYADTDLGLVYYNYRHYNPLDGRWCNEDLLATGLNAYQYIRNNPVSISYDYLGLKGATTHGIKRCNKEDTCLLLAAKASQWIASFSERYVELTADKYNLKQTNPYRYNSHIDELINAKQQAKRCLTYLAEKIREKQCCKPGDKKPDSIPNFSPKPIPDKIPQKREDADTGGIQSDDVVEGVLVAGGAAVAGYVAYRIIRLLPSLLPPLWPTLAPNLLIP
ncbi:MAG: RHS repeat-associated core domain-containing protein, partial [Roseburia sp.]|nr:RHS repeat-associated core domain-containing protein [Roseburia sp.]